MEFGLNSRQRERPRRAVANRKSPTVVETLLDVSAESKACDENGLPRGKESL